jgi:hypothetical protein
VNERRDPLSKRGRLAIGLSEDAAVREFLARETREFLARGTPA